MAEGFADYVALHDDKAPLSVSAGQILRKVKADGAPKALPSPEDFDGGEHGLGAVYEAAWMVFRMLGEQYGDAACAGSTRDVMSGRMVDDRRATCVRPVRRALTADWRAT